MGVALATWSGGAYLVGVGVHPEQAVAREVASADEAIDRAYRAARARLGKLGVPPALFRRHVEELVRTLPGIDGPGQLLLEDLYLALGCQRGDERAWRALHDSLGGYLRRLSNRAAGGEVAGEELFADLLADLVGRPRSPGKIQLYRGLASLATWLAVIIRRMAVDRARAGDRQARQESLEDGPELSGRGTPEALLLREEAVRIGERLLGEVLAGLPPAQELVLRLVYWDGLTLREAGRVLGVDFSTVSRRLKSAREHVLRELRARSRQEYGLSAEALGELVAQLGPEDGEEGAG
jgi:RNA polymerase sigma-70 factor